MSFVLFRRCREHLQKQTRVILSILIITAWCDAGWGVDFSHDVVPILKQHCAKCHIGANKKGGLSFNTREALLQGGDNGAVIKPGASNESSLISVIVSRDPDIQMPPEGDRLTDKEVAILTDWVNAGPTWDEGFVFQKPAYEPPLKPRRPELPPVVEGRTNPIDRLIDDYLSSHQKERPKPLDDVAFARRTSLDLVGLLPSVDDLKQFLADKRPDRRERWVKDLLAKDAAYAEHWLTFWNDLLRNDYGGTGFITGGRKQISKWLYRSLTNNKPYDQMVRELIAPTAESAGFSEGIRWRGTVSAGQTVEIQFAQSVGQAFLGINLKCASCHDSFIDRWKLEEAYGLAAIYSNQTLDIHRCDKPIGKQAVASWLFPELGQVNPSDPQPERLKQLAGLMTHPENGRFTRTIVNRLWHRLMGRGIVHPVDAMQTEPWNADLLDFLAVDFADHHYDLKHTLELIATSTVYQSQSEIISPQSDNKDYVFAGPRAKRLTAEQFVDAVWQITGTAPTKIDAPFARGKLGAYANESDELKGHWVWSSPDAFTKGSAPGETITIRKKFTLPADPVRVGGVFSCDNECRVYINGSKVYSASNWEQIDGVVLDAKLHSGKNEILIVGKNGGDSPNPAAIFGQVLARMPDGSLQSFATDETWEWTSTEPDDKGLFKKHPKDWKPVATAAEPSLWSRRVQDDLRAHLAQVVLQPQMMVRASLLKSDFLQRTLGRPNRDQIVTTRPNDLSTLEALDLNNTQVLADELIAGAKKWLGDYGSDQKKLVQDVYMTMLSRTPTNEEESLALESLGPKPAPEQVEDLLWAILMLPEFQLVR